MKIVQEIVIALLKSMCFTLLASSINEHERRFIMNLRMSGYDGNLQVITVGDQNYFLIWESIIGTEVGCPINENEFRFSETRKFNRNQKCLGTGFDPEEQQKVEREIKEIKTIFRLFTSLIDTCCK